MPCDGEQRFSWASCTAGLQVQRLNTKGCQLAARQFKRKTTHPRPCFTRNQVTKRVRQSCLDAMAKPDPSPSPQLRRPVECRGHVAQTAKQDAQNPKPTLSQPMRCRVCQKCEASAPRQRALSFAPTAHPPENILYLCYIPLYCTLCLIMFYSSTV